MAAEIETPFGHALPPFPSHSITVHIPKWVTVLQFIDNAQEVTSRVSSLYPRFGPFGHVKEFIRRFSADSLKEGYAGLPFASKDSAEACRLFLLSDNRAENKATSDEVKVQAVDFGEIRVWITSFPAPKTPGAVPFWQDMGTGISSRLAQDLLKHYDSKAVQKSVSDPNRGLSTDTKAFSTVKARIVDLLNRSPISSHSVTARPNDVFLYPTGMAAIYQLHRYIQNSGLRPGSTVLFGFAFHSTPHVYKEYSTNFKWLGKGDDEDLKHLESFCSDEIAAGRKVQAVWTEFPTNPNLRSVNLKQLRALADKYGFFLFVDDTISSFCNVDVLGMTDAIVTSLTKSFSGYANVMGGSVVLNPKSIHYHRLGDLMRERFTNEFYSADVEALEQNSRDYLERSKVLNQNASAVAQYLQALVSDPSSAVSGVAYPSVEPGKAFYQEFMRPQTADFEPGYGCLLSVELDSIESTVAFYDNLHVHQGPHLGAHLTLALPYVKAIGAKEIPWYEECDMNERMLRISVGLEETDVLMETFKTAVRAADAVKRKNPLDKAVNPIN